MQPALTLGLGAANNLSSLDFSQEGLAAASVKASYIEPQSKTTIALPPLPPLRVPPLALRPTPSRKVTLLRDTANKPVADALQAMAAALGRQPDTVDGHGELDSARYGHVLRARRLVGVRGAGLSYDGVYCVRSVSHHIARGAYRQRFALSREGTGALTPMVVA